MNRWVGATLFVFVMAGLYGCAGRTAERFTLELDLPAGFAALGDATYTPAPGETCKLPKRMGKRPELKIFKAASKPVANRVSFDVPLTESVDGCALVVRELVFALNARWGTRWSDIGRDYAIIYFRDNGEAWTSPMPESGVLELHGQCQWVFRTVGYAHALIKGLRCRSLDDGGQITTERPGGYVTRDGLAGRTLRMTWALSEEESPADGDNWVSVPGGWRRCMGESQDDVFGFCRGNVTDFKRFKMPDGRFCSIYPTCY
ncbi:hypothetical protein [Pseudomonas sp. MH9.3]|uniref:hypothetical protein n=1 Tax=Pseudomonas sp. MH9.3 TaxID=3048630 RepID=UPI002AC9A595|nr:hypothetical protein [Pseudomonas sp. MH9.3]MEB0107776.1 hypothetical protein [Pseudomonas sp. MH9.3]WPX79617.1 hypothetical protein RHM60_00405 [Pseudomonas sp. MH9.3]WQG58251.1 hypothetical protein RHM66_00190 [Pseudomonas sp. RTB3]